jgi:hypothetical protein
MEIKANKSQLIKQINNAKAIELKIVARKRHITKIIILNLHKRLKISMML